MTLQNWGRITPRVPGSTTGSLENNEHYWRVASWGEIKHLGEKFHRISSPNIYTLAYLTSGLFRCKFKTALILCVIAHLG